MTEYQPGDVVEIHGVITILKHEKALRTAIGTSRGILARPTNNGFWRVRLETGQLALVHHTAFGEIVGKIEIEVVDLGKAGSFITGAMPRPEPTWQDSEKDCGKQI